MSIISYAFSSAAMRVSLIIALFFASCIATAQPTDVAPMGDWKEFKQTTYRGQPVLIHLRTGYERAVLMPEPVRVADENPDLPGCDIIVDNEVIGFYPRRSFKRITVAFIGIESGVRYELAVRSSTLGIRQPLEITR